MPEIQWTISLGTMLHGGLIILTIVGLWVGINTRLTRLETMLQPIWSWWNSDPTSATNRVKTSFDEKVEHAVRGAVANAVREVLKQDRDHRGAK